MNETDDPVLLRIERINERPRRQLPSRRTLLDLDRTALAEMLDDQPGFRVEQVWTAIHHKGLTPDEMTAIPKALRATLAERFHPPLTDPIRQDSADGRTVKWSFGLDGGARVESVLMRYDERATACVSSQAGCAMACEFCATGQAGFERHLTVAEILAQVHTVRRAAEPQRLSNVVFMGMGEPLANYDNVFAAAERITDDIGIGARRITVSTVGLVPAMERFAAEGRQNGLAVSLHAANDEKRTRLVPINARHPIGSLVDACNTVRDRTGRRVSFEWAMIDGVNDTPDDATELAVVANRARAHVNLIPLNRTPGYPMQGSPRARILRFADRLRGDGVNVTIRSTMGDDIDAACGQLATRAASGAATRTRR